jgi:hypothetical protein
MRCCLFDSLESYFTNHSFAVNQRLFLADDSSQIVCGCLGWIFTIILIGLTVVFVINIIKRLKGEP